MLIYAKGVGTKIAQIFAKRLTSASLFGTDIRNARIHLARGEVSRGGRIGLRIGRGEPLMGEQKTLTEMAERVKEGLRIAREAVEDEALLKLCDDLEYTWETLCSNLIIVGVGISAMRYRTREQITEQLRQYLMTIKSTKEQRARFFVPETEHVN